MNDEWVGAGSEGEDPPIPFGRPSFSDAEIAATAGVLRSGWIGAGHEVAAFELELATYVRAPCVRLLNSCTAALTLSLILADVGPGDEVICPALNWFADANAIVQRGAAAVFCDIDPGTLNVTAASVEERLSSRTKAVIVVHFGGLACPVADIAEVLPGGVTLIEDAAHAFGATFPDGTPVGGSGHFTCFSFYANKNLSTGDGGALAIFDPEAGDRVGWLRQQGVRSDAWGRQFKVGGTGTPELVEPGYKMAMTDLAAAIGRVQLRRQGEFARTRSMVASRYVEMLGDPSLGLRFQHDILERHHARHLFAVQLAPEWTAERRAGLVRRLRAQGLGASVHYSPLHLEPSYGDHDGLSVTEAVSDRLVMLPISASMSEADAERSAATVRAALVEP